MDVRHSDLMLRKLELIFFELSFDAGLRPLFLFCSELFCFSVSYFCFAVNRFRFAVN